MRPALSGSTSTAPESRKRLKPRVSACANESACNFSATFFHASSAKRKRHASNPRVITIFLPSAFAKALGNVTRFFSSRVCSYSPMSIKNCASGACEKFQHWMQCEAHEKNSASRTMLYGERYFLKCNEAMRQWWKFSPTFSHYLRIIHHFCPPQASYPHLRIRGLASRN